MKIMLDLFTFHNELAVLLNEGRAVDVVDLDSCKAFHTVSHNLTTDKQRKYGLDKGIVKWTANCPGAQAQSVVISSTESNWRQIISGISQSSVLRSVLFTVFIYDMNDEKECSHSKFADDIETGSSGG